MNYTMLHFLLILMLHISPATRSERMFVASDSLFDSNYMLILGNRDGWRLHPGDDLNRAKSDFDYSDWMIHKPAGQAGTIFTIELPINKN